MTTESRKIGDFISFSDSRYQYAYRQYTELKPLIAEFVRLYQQATKQDLTTEVFIIAMKHGVDEIVSVLFSDNPDKKKIDQLPEALKVFSSNLIDEQSRKLAAARNAIQNQINFQARLNSAELIDWNDVQIKGGKVEVLTERLKERFTLRITNDQQIEFLNAMEATKLYWDKTVLIAANHGYNIKSWPAYGHDRFFVEADEDAFLKLNLNSIEWITD